MARFNYGGGVLEKASSATPQQNSNKAKSKDDALYQQAIQFARDKYGDSRVSNADFLNTVDTQFAKLGGSKTGREMRGDTFLDDFARGVNDVSGAVNTTVGNGMDWLFDNTAGNLAGLFAGDKVGNDVKNWFTGEDLAIIPDIASDVALYASGWGIPIAVTKGVARSAGDIKDAVTGKDSITLEDLDGDQRFARGAIGGLGAALSALPAVGKVANIAKGASKVGAIEAADTAKTAAKSAADDVAKAEKELKDAIAKAGADNKAGIKSAAATKKSAEEAMDAAQKRIETGILGDIDVSMLSEAEQKEFLSNFVDDIWPNIEKYYKANGEFPTWRELYPDQNLSLAVPRVTSKLNEAVDNIASYTKASKTVKDTAKVEDAGKALDEKVSAYKEALKAAKEKGGKKIAEAKEAQGVADSALEDAESYADMSGIGRVFSQLGEDNRSFLQALRDLPETVSSSREQIKAQKELRKLLKQANLGAKKGASEKDIDALVTKLVERLGKGDDAAQLKYIKDLVQKAGYGDEGLASLPRNATTHKFKPRDIPAPKIFPGIGRTFRDALSDVGYKSNASFRRVAADTQEDMLKRRFLGAMREGQLKNASGAAKAANNVRTRFSDPNSGWGNVKATLAGQAMSLPLIPLSLQAQYGGDYADNINRLAADVRQNGVGKLLPAVFPVGGGRQFATRALPGMRGIAGKYYPFGAIRAKDTIDQFQNLYDDNTGRGKYAEALNNLKGGK